MPPARAAGSDAGISEQRPTPHAGALLEALAAPGEATCAQPSRAHPDVRCGKITSLCSGFDCAVGRTLVCTQALFKGPHLAKGVHTKVFVHRMAGRRAHCIRLQGGAGPQAA